jgi:hypothetical protein
MEKTIEINEHGVMMTDYFNGTSGVMISLHVDNKTTKKEALELLKEEISMVFDHIEYTAEYHGVTYDDVKKAIDTEFKEMESYIEKTKDEILCPDLEHCFADMTDDENDNEFPVAFLQSNLISYNINARFAGQKKE